MKSSNRVVDLAGHAQRKAEILRQIDDFFALHEAHHTTPQPKGSLNVNQLPEIECYTCNESFRPLGEKGGRVS